MTYKKKKELPLIMIGQQQRCGGSLLTRLFDSHPELYTHPLENYFGRPYKYHWPVIDTSKPIDDIWRELVEYPLKHMGRKGRIHKGEHESYPFLYDSVSHKKMFLEILQGRKMGERIIIQAYFESLFESYSNYTQPQNPRFYSYFTPRQCLYAEEFFSAVPEGHIIQIVRHPAAYYNSVKSHNRYYDIQTAKFLWRLFFFQALYSNLIGWHNYHVVIFEKLVNEPEKTLRGLCANLEIRYHESLAHPTFNGKVWGGDSNFGALKGISKNVIDHYKKFLPQNEIESFAQEIQWYEEYIAEPEIDKGFLDRFAKLIQWFQKFLAVYKREKPANTPGMIFSDPNLYFKVLGHRNSFHMNYFRLMAEMEAKALFSEQEIESPEKLTEHVDFHLDAPLFEKLEDSKMFANCVINLWVLKGKSGISEALMWLPSTGFSLKDVLENIEYQIKRDGRLITNKFTGDLKRAIGRCSDDERKKIVQIRNMLRQKTSTKIIKKGIGIAKGLLKRI